MADIGSTSSLWLRHHIQYYEICEEETYKTSLSCLIGMLIVNWKGWPRAYSLMVFHMLPV